MAERKITLDVDVGAKTYLASTGYSPVYGARPLNRAIQSELLNPLSVMLLSNKIQDGEVARVEFDGPANRLFVRPNHDVPQTDEDMDVDDSLEVEEMD